MPAEQGRGLEKIPLFLIFLGHLWVDTSQGILPIILPKLKDLFVLNYFEVGIIMTILNLTSSVIQPLFGHISDRPGRRIVIAGSMLLYPPLMSLMIMSDGIWLWILAGASGITLLASFSVTIVLAQELLPRHLGLASGLILRLGFGTGGLGTAFSGYLADNIGLYNTSWILALAPLLGAVLTVFIRKRHRPPDRCAVRRGYYRTKSTSSKRARNPLWFQHLS